MRNDKRIGMFGVLWRAANLAVVALAASAVTLMTTGFGVQGTKPLWPWFGLALAATLAFRYAFFRALPPQTGRVEKEKQVPRHRFHNSSDEPLFIWVEPWCDELVVPPGSTLTISFDLAPGEDDQTLIELSGEGVTYWCGGDTYAVELDGRAVPT